MNCKKFNNNNLLHWSNRMCFFSVEASNVAHEAMSLAKTDAPQELKQLLDQLPDGAARLQAIKKSVENAAGAGAQAAQEVITRMQSQATTEKPFDEVQARAAALRAAKTAIENQVGNIMRGALGPAKEAVVAYQKQKAEEAMKAKEAAIQAKKGLLDKAQGFAGEHEVLTTAALVGAVKAAPYVPTVAGGALRLGGNAIAATARGVWSAGEVGAGALEAVGATGVATGVGLLAADAYIWKEGVYDQYQTLQKEKGDLHYFRAGTQIEEGVGHSLAGAYDVSKIDNQTTGTGDKQQVSKGDLPREVEAYGSWLRGASSLARKTASEILSQTAQYGGNAKVELPKIRAMIAYGEEVKKRVGNLSAADGVNQSEIIEATAATKVLDAALATGKRMVKEVEDGKEKPDVRGYDVYQQGMTEKKNALLERNRFNLVSALDKLHQEVGVLKVEPGQTEALQVKIVALKAKVKDATDLAPLEKEGIDLQKEADALAKVDKTPLTGDKYSKYLDQFLHSKIKNPADAELFSMAAGVLAARLKDGMTMKDLDEAANKIFPGEITRDTLPKNAGYFSEANVLTPAQQAYLVSMIERAKDEPRLIGFVQEYEDYIRNTVENQAWQAQAKAAFDQGPQNYAQFISGSIKTPEAFFDLDKVKATPAVQQAAPNGSPSGAPAARPAGGPANGPAAAPRNAPAVKPDAQPQQHENLADRDVPANAEINTGDKVPQELLDAARQAFYVDMPGKQKKTYSPDEIDKTVGKHVLSGKKLSNGYYLAAIGEAGSTNKDDRVLLHVDNGKTTVVGVDGSPATLVAENAKDKIAVVDEHGKKKEDAPDTAVAAAPGDKKAPKRT